MGHDGADADWWPPGGTECSLQVLCGEQAGCRRQGWQKEPWACFPTSLRPSINPVGQGLLWCESCFSGRSSSLDVFLPPELDGSLSPPWRPDGGLLESSLGPGREDLDGSPFIGKEPKAQLVTCHGNGRTAGESGPQPHSPCCFAPPPLSTSHRGQAGTREASVPHGYHTRDMFLPMDEATHPHQFVGGGRCLCPMPSPKVPHLPGSQFTCW